MNGIVNTLRVKSVSRYLNEKDRVSVNFDLVNEQGDVWCDVNLAESQVKALPKVGEYVQVVLSQVPVDDMKGALLASVGGLVCNRLVVSERYEPPAKLSAISDGLKEDVPAERKPNVVEVTCADGDNYVNLTAPQLAAGGTLFFPRERYALAIHQSY